MSLPSAPSYEAGALIVGKYRLERMLGEGGMGSVWAAHHVLLDTRVAVKLIRANTNRQELAPRLIQEARAAAKLGHPAIVRIFDVGQTADGDPFIVMELLEGESLNQRLERDHRLSAIEAARLLLPIADALRAAHAKGIVHRDIKPDNVFLMRDETGLQPKLVDFGIAKLQARDFDSQLTQRGVIVGSPDYMAPEQARGEEDIDGRADIWAFCVLLYETVSGQPPFDAPNYNALLHAIQETPPPPLTTMCAGDAEFGALVERGLAKNRAERWQTMQELGEALARWLLSQGVFEDAAGNAIEAKWIQRRTDTNHRESRPSLGSISGFAATKPGVDGSTTARRRAAEAPTSFGPVVTATRRRRRPVWLLPASLGVVALAALSARVLWPNTPSSASTPSATAQTRAAALPAANAVTRRAPAPTPSVTVVVGEPAVPVAPSATVPSTGTRRSRSRGAAAGGAATAHAGAADAKSNAPTSAPVQTKGTAELLSPY